MYKLQTVSIINLKTPPDSADYPIPNQLQSFQVFIALGPHCH